MNRSILVPHAWSNVNQRLHYLGIVGILVRRDLKIKYRDSVLGYAWSMLNPLLFMIILSVVFGGLFRSIPNYSLHVLCGILTWNLGSLAIITGTHSIVGSGSLMRKIKLPVWIFPFVPVGAALVNFVLALIPFTIMVLFNRHPIGWHITLLPLLILLFVVFVMGIALVLSTLNVFFRDVGHVLEPVLQLLFYATPVIYDRHQQSFPPTIANLLNMNPFTHYIESIRFALIGTGEFSLAKLLLLTAFSLVSLGIGALVYKRGRRSIIFYV